MKLLKVGLAAALAVAAVLAPARRADAVIVERIVAVVGDRPILYSELRHRAKPNLLMALAAGKDENYLSAERTEIYKMIMNKMIDERLEESAAEKSHISVQPEDVDRGIQNVASNNRISVGTLLGELRKQGLSEQDFRDLIRLQIMEAKLKELRVRPRVRVTDQDARAAYTHWRAEIAEKQPVEIRIIAMRIPAGATEAQVLGRQQLADSIVARARGGQDYCELVKMFTEDTETKDSCGSRGAVPKAQLLPEIRELVSTMKPGQISDPIRVRSVGDAIVIIQMASQFSAPPYEQVKDQMTQLAAEEALDRETRLWLQELRRGVYIDVRL